MDFHETGEQRALRAAVAALAGDFGHAYYLEKSRAGTPGHELWAALGRQGFLGVHLPEEYGGGGGGVYELHLVAEELAAAGCPVLLTAVSPAICGSILAAHGTPEQRRRWLPGIASGELVMAFAVTEPDAGSNTRNLATTATRQGGEVVLRGTKQFISGLDEAHAVLVVARTGADAAGRARLGLVIVPTDAAGLDRTRIPMEIRAPEHQYTLFLDDVRVPADHLVGGDGDGDGDGLRAVFAGLNPERILGAAIGGGVGRYALGKAAGYARERRVWGVPVGAHQGVAHPLAHASIQVELARLMTQRAAWLHDAGDPAAGSAANMAKYAAAEAGLLALDQAMQAHGGNGLATEYGLATLWGAVRLLRTAPISKEMILNHVAQHGLGLPRSY